MKLSLGAVKIRDCAPYIDPEVYAKWQALGSGVPEEGEARPSPLTEEERYQFHAAPKMLLVHQLLPSVEADELRLGLAAAGRVAGGREGTSKRTSGEVQEKDSEDDMDGLIDSEVAAKVTAIAQKLHASRPRVGGGSCGHYGGGARDGVCERLPRGHTGVVEGRTTRRLLGRTGLLTRPG